jgi:hypothetical protein
VNWSLLLAIVEAIVVALEHVVSGNDDAAVAAAANARVQLNAAKEKVES